MKSLSAITKLDGILVISETLEAIRPTSCLTFTNKNVLVNRVLPGHYKGLAFVRHKEGVWALKLGYINSICLEIIIVSNTRKVIEYNMLRKFLLLCISKAIMKMHNTTTKTLWISSICHDETKKLHSITVPVDEIKDFGCYLFDELSEVNEFVETNTLRFKYFFSQLGGSYLLNGTNRSGGKNVINQFSLKHIDEIVVHIAHDLKVDRSAIFLKQDSKIAKNSQIIKNKTWYNVCLLAGAGNFTATLSDEDIYPKITNLQIYSKIFSTFHLKESGTPFKSEEILSIFFAIFSKKKKRDVEKLISTYKAKLAMIVAYMNDLKANENTGFQTLRIEFVICNTQVKDKTVEMLLKSFLDTTAIFIHENNLLDNNQYFIVFLTDLYKYLIKHMTPSLNFIDDFVALCEKSCMTTNQQMWTVPNFGPCSFYSVLAAQIILACVFYGKAQSFKRNIRHNNEICRELGLGSNQLKAIDVGLNYSGSKHISFQNNQIQCSLSKSVLQEFEFQTTLLDNKCGISDKIWSFWSDQTPSKNNFIDLARFIVNNIYGRGNGSKTWGFGTILRTKLDLKCEDRIYQVMLVNQFCNFLSKETCRVSYVSINQLDIWFLRFLCGNEDTIKVSLLFKEIERVIVQDLVREKTFFAYQIQTESTVHAILVVPEYFIEVPHAFVKPEADIVNHLEKFASIYAKAYHVLNNQSSKQDFKIPMMDFMIICPDKTRFFEQFALDSLNDFFEFMHQKVIRRR